MRRSRLLSGVMLLVAVGLTPAGALAQDNSGSAPPPASSSGPVLTQSAAMVDTVILRSGGLYRGRLTEIVPGDHVTIVVENGETRRLAWAEVERIATGTGVPSSPAGAPAPAPTPAGSTAVASETPPASAPSGPRTEWRANRPLLVTGAILFAGGYGPNAVAALPSTAGLVGRVLLLVLTIGLPCLFDNSGDYLCHGSHGAMQLLIPFAGPVLFANNHPHDSVINQNGGRVSDTAKGFLYVSAGLQIAGVASILAAIATGGHEVVEPSRRHSRETRPSVYVAPLDAPGSIGLSVGVHRW